MTGATAAENSAASEPVLKAAPGQRSPPRAKEDPETLVLRGKPARVTRFRKDVIVAIGGTVAVSIASVSWLALRPAASGERSAGEDSVVAAGPKLPEAIAGAPSGYGDIPQLGPKLPGDLGRPMLRHRREADQVPSHERIEDPSVRAVQAAEAERQRLAAEELAARESGIMMRSGSASGATSPAKAALANSAAQDASASAGEPDANGRPRKSEPAGQGNGRDNASPHRLQEPVSPFALQAGSVIAASLITGLNSDLPGLVTAQVTENVYDSIAGNALLIPQGSRLVGSYDRVVAFGQSRALVIWQRILMPDGSSIRIDNVPATDMQGYAGLSDRIDRHTWQLLKGVALSTLLGVGTQLGRGGDESDLVRAVREAAQQSGTRAGDQLVTRSLDVQPTLKVRPGWPLRIVVHQDIILRPWRS